MSSAREPGRTEGIIERISSPWLVPFDGGLETAPAIFSAPDANKDRKRHLKEARKAIRPYQHKLYASKQYGILLIFQALDAAGKDGAIRELFEGFDPAGVNISAFKKPTSRESSHDFLWRTSRPCRQEVKSAFSTAVITRKC